MLQPHEVHKQLHPSAAACWASHAKPAGAV